jgi:hypothetical protein
MTCQRRPLARLRLPWSPPIFAHIIPLTDCGSGVVGGWVLRGGLCLGPRDPWMRMHLRIPRDARNPPQPGRPSFLHASVETTMTAKSTGGGVPPPFAHAGGQLLGSGRLPRAWMPKPRRTRAPNWQLKTVKTGKTDARPPRSGRLFVIALSSGESATFTDARPRQQPVR